MSESQDREPRTCEVCPEPTSEEGSDVPADDGYVAVVVPDDEVIEGALPRETYEFCSFAHAALFFEGTPEGTALAPPGDVATGDVAAAEVSMTDRSNADDTETDPDADPDADATAQDNGGENA